MIYPGFIMARLARWAKDHRERVAELPESNHITINRHKSRYAHGVIQASVRVNGDPHTYRMLIAPMDTPIEIGGVPVSKAFLETVEEEGEE